jgi:hypothetical protein
MLLLSATPRALLGAWALVTGLAVAVSGCVSRDDLTVWKAAVPSPDQEWIASADTVQNGGFGSASITTSVYLQKARDPGPPVTVLALSCQGPMPRPYVLDNVANAGGSIHLSMRWLDGSHLRVTYDSHPSVILHVAQVHDISVSVADLSGAPNTDRG